jgi:hypothetical protein
VVPDFVFGLQLKNDKRLNFMVEIDRGTMPVSRSDPDRTSFEQKMRVYLAAHAAKQHERQFGWKNFRVLTVTTDPTRVRSMQEVVRRTHTAGGTGTTLLQFGTFDELRATSPLAFEWRDSAGRSARLA